VEAVVLAGGLGSRLRSVVSEVPKPMAPVAGRPFLEILLAQLGDGGVRRVVLSVGHLGQVISGHFGDRFRGIDLAYAVEDQPLGTGGGLRAALARIEGERALVANGDTWVELDHRDLWRRHETTRRGDPSLRITMALHRVDDASRYGRVVVEEGRVVRFDAAGRDGGAGAGAGSGWINAGIYVVEKTLLDDPDLPERFSFEGDFLSPRLETLRPLAYETCGRFIDIGVPEDYRRAQALLAAAGVGTG
jgi:D-glycero-alpha-D-manno-heptose 1-phosphate guanylyltransferase